jgi:hypothetical protein
MCAIRCHWIANSSHSFLIVGSDASRACCSLARALNRYVEDGSTMHATMNAHILCAYSCASYINQSVIAKIVSRMFPERRRSPASFQQIPVRPFSVWLRLPKPYPARTCLAHTAPSCAAGMRWALLALIIMNSWMARFCRDQARHS